MIHNLFRRCKPSKLNLKNALPGQDSISECFQQGPMQEIFDSLILLLDIQIFPVAVLAYKTISLFVTPDPIPNK